MLKPTNFAIFCGFFLMACQPQTHLVKSDSQSQELKDLKDADSSITNLITPYKIDLEKEMNSVIGQTAKMLTKAKPESTLGNWAVDLTHKKCEDYLDRKIDFAVHNFGGMRIPSLPQGDITKGKIFELMPFDNLLVVIEMKGKDLSALFHHMASKGGWPISKQVKMTIHGDKAIDVRINNKKVVDNQTYSFATNDYIASGGDKCSFLKGQTQFATGVLFRDAIIQYIEEETKAGRKLDANIEKRIFILK